MSSPYAVTMEHQVGNSTKELYYVVFAEKQSQARDRAVEWAQSEGKQSVTVKLAHPVGVVTNSNE